MKKLKGELRQKLVKEGGTCNQATISTLAKKEIKLNHSDRKESSSKTSASNQAMVFDS